MGLPQQRMATAGRRGRAEQAAEDGKQRRNTYEIRTNKLTQVCNGMTIIKQNINIASIV